VATLRIWCYHLLGLIGVADFQNVVLLPYYLNSNRLAVLASTTFPPVVHRSLANNNGDRAHAMHGVCAVAESLLRSGPFQNLTQVVATQDVEGQRILGFVWASFTFSGAGGAVNSERDCKPHQNAKLKATLSLGAADYHLFGEMHNEHYFSMSSLSTLTNKRHMLIAGIFQFQEKDVEVFPYIIGEVAQETTKARRYLANFIRVYPQSIDAFSRITGRPDQRRQTLRQSAACPRPTLRELSPTSLGSLSSQKTGEARNPIW
jgi:hypothetical protein